MGVETERARQQLPAVQPCNRNFPAPEHETSLYWPFPCYKAGGTLDTLRHIPRTHIIKEGTWVIHPLPRTIMHQKGGHIGTETKVKWMCLFTKTVSLKNKAVKARCVGGAQNFNASILGTEVRDLLRV